jgi:heptosyltransferase-2
VKPHRGKILVIRGGAIGDFILTLPAIAALRTQFPEAHLEVMGYPHIAQLGAAAGFVDKVQSIESRALACFFARGGQLSEDLADYFSEFDIIVSYLYDPDLVFQSNVALCTGAQFIAGPHRPDETGNASASQVFLKPLERLAIFDADPIPRLGLPAVVPVPGQVALHPGSGSESKNWPEEKWAGLLEMIASTTPFSVVLVGGEAEGAKLQRLAATFPPARLRVAQSVPLAELAALLASCASFVGHDSGISHLAAAVGLPCVILWGHTNERIWRPPGGKILLLQDPRGLTHIPVSKVCSALNEVILP